jgi:integrase
MTIRAGRLRIGEILGLQWGDLQAGELKVRRAVDTAGNVGLAKHDKTREVPLSAASLKLVPDRDRRRKTEATPPGNDPFETGRPSIPLEFLALTPRRRQTDTRRSRNPHTTPRWDDVVFPVRRSTRCSRA